MEIAFNYIEGIKSDIIIAISRKVAGFLEIGKVEIEERNINTPGSSIKKASVIIRVPQGRMVFKSNPVNTFHLNSLDDIWNHIHIELIEKGVKEFIKSNLIKNEESKTD